MCGYLFSKNICTKVVVLLDTIYFFYETWNFVKSKTIALHLIKLSQKEESILVKLWIKTETSCSKMCCSCYYGYSNGDACWDSCLPPIQDGGNNLAVIYSLYFWGVNYEYVDGKVILWWNLPMQLTFTPRPEQHLQPFRSREVYFSSSICLVISCCGHLFPQWCMNIKVALKDSWKKRRKRRRKRKQVSYIIYSRKEHKSCITLICIKSFF